MSLQAPFVDGLNPNQHRQACPASSETSPLSAHIEDGDGSADGAGSSRSSIDILLVEGKGQGLEVVSNQRVALAISCRWHCIVEQGFTSCEPRGVDKDAPFISSSQVLTAQKRFQ
jgi:hypothetical protein